MAATANRLLPLLTVLWVSLCAPAARARPADAGAEATVDQTSDDPRRRPYRPSLNVHTLTTDDGLPTETGTAIAQDHAGFLWMGSPAGLAHYDGRRIQVLPHAQSGAQLDDPRITALHASVDDATTWVGTQEGGLHRLRDVWETVGVYGTDEGLTSNTITALTRGPDSALWAGTPEGLNRIDPETGEVATFRHRDGDPKSLPHDLVLTLFPDEDTLWIGTARGLASVDLSNPDDPVFVHHERHLIAPGPVTAIARDHEGFLWYGTKAGLYQMVEDAFRFFHHDPTEATSLSSDSVTALLVDRNGTLWVGTERDGLNRYDRENDRFIRHLRNSWINALFEDRDGVLWVARNEDGFAFIPPTSFITYHPDPTNLQGLQGDSVWDFSRGTDGSLWIATTGHTAGGLYRLDRTEGKVDRYFHDPNDPASLSSNDVVRIARDFDGTFWLGTLGGGLNHFDPETGNSKSYMVDWGDPRSLPSNNISALRVDQDGRLWIGTLDAGLAQYHKDSGLFTRYVLADENLNNAIFSITPDVREADVLWLGTSEGVFRLNTRTKAVRQFAPDPDDPKSLSHKEISSIYQDGQGILWIGALFGGLNRLDPETGRVRRFGVEQGLANDTVNCILEDESRHLWISTNAGLSRFSVTDQTLLNFDRSDGVSAGEFTEGGCFADPVTGELLFAASHGLVIIDPAQLELDRRPPDVDILGYRIFSQDINPLNGDEAGSVSCSYRDVVTFDFAVLSFAGSAPASYLLDGLEDEWRSAQDTRSITYSHLPPGKYVFRVRAANRHGVPSDEGDAVELHVAPPPWKTWWAYLSYVCAALGAVAGVFRYQRRRVQHLQQEMRLAEAERDLDLAAAAQSWFLPNEPLKISGSIAVCGSYRPASKCGGDWWWYEELDGAAWALVGDVTGHGAGPGVLTAAIATALRTSRSDGKPADIPRRLRRLHEEMRDVCPDVYHMTVTAVLIDEASGRATIYGCGGLPVLLVDQAGKGRALPCPGNPLGSHEFEVSERSVQLNAGDRLLVLTDGLPESPVSGGKMMGLRRVMNSFVATSSDQSVQHHLDAFVAATDELRLTEEQDDDITMVLMEWAGRDS